MDIGANIKTIRKSKGITQKELATSTGIPYRTLQDYENNKIKEPALSKLNIIATKLGVTLSELMGDKKILLDESDLKTYRLYLAWLESQIIEPLYDLEGINNKIKTENDPEELRELFDESKTYDNLIKTQEASIREYKEKISKLCEKLGITEEDLEPISEKDKENLKQFNHINYIEQNINFLFKPENNHIDKVNKEMPAERFRLYKKLFTVPELKFLMDALFVLSKIKTAVEDAKNYKREDILNILIDFYSDENLGLDPEMIKLNLNDIMDKK